MSLVLLLTRLARFMGTGTGRALGIALAVAVGVSALIVFVRQEALENVDEQNDKAGDAADAAEIGFLRCRDGGGVWVFGQPGHCIWPDTGGG